MDTHRKMSTKVLTDPLTLLVKYGLIDRGDGTIYDTRTKLLWQQVSPDRTYIWQDAQIYCKGLGLAGHNNWRLPTIEELKTLIERRHQPTICPVFECKSDWYWSSTSNADSPGFTWLVNFYNGFVYSDHADQSFRYHIRAVCCES